VKEKTSQYILSVKKNEDKEEEDVESGEDENSI
jgi:hypothetical protein